MKMPSDMKKEPVKTRSPTAAISIKTMWNIPRFILWTCLKFECCKGSN